MKDLRCIVALHSYAPKQYPAGDRFVDDVPGLRLECNRCHKPAGMRIGRPSTPPSPGMPTITTTDIRGQV